jgi:serine/threonine protein kinase
MAPEDLKHKEFTPASDVFMFGMTMWEMFARTPPYPDKDNLECAFEVVEGTLKPEQVCL